MDVLGLVRCAVCRASLHGSREHLACIECGAQYGAVGGVPLLIPEPDLEAIDLRGDERPLGGHDCAGLNIPAIDDAIARGDLMLEIGAGREVSTAPNIVRTDAFVFSADSLDVVADVHALPFADETFDFVFSLAVFEHLHSPWQAASEIARVLRPGGLAYTQCAFMQPMHGYPDHYFNLTESGLRRLFSDAFDVEFCRAAEYLSQAGHRQICVQLYRMREMAEAHGVETRADWRTRWRRRRLERALTTATHQFQQLGDQLLEAPGAHEPWRAIASVVELLGRRR